jgi:hypothetical protein
LASGSYRHVSIPSKLLVPQDSERTAHRFFSQFRCVNAHFRLATSDTLH